MVRLLEQTFGEVLTSVTVQLKFFNFIIVLLAKNVSSQMTPLVLWAALPLQRLWSEQMNGFDNYMQKKLSLNPAFEINHSAQSWWQVHVT